jgi:hypothetical protein
MKTTAPLLLTAALALAACDRPVPVGGNCTMADAPTFETPDGPVPVEAGAFVYAYYSAGSCAPAPVQGLELSCEGCALTEPTIDDGQGFHVGATGPGEVTVTATYPKKEGEGTDSQTFTITYVAGQTAPLTLGSPAPSPEDRLITYTQASGARHTCRPAPLGVVERFGLKATDAVIGYMCKGEIRFKDGSTRLPQPNWSSDAAPDLVLCTTQDAAVVGAWEEWSWDKDDNLTRQTREGTESPLCATKER